MTEPERRVERAVRMTPAQDRARYSEEWRGDLAGAQAEGVPARDVGRGAQRVARRLRAKELARILLGSRGMLRAALAWLVLVAVAVAAWWFGGIVLLLAAGVVVGLVVVLAWAGVPSHWSHWAMVGSVVLGLAALVVAGRGVAASVEAADTFAPEPAIARWTGTALVVLLLSGCVLVASALVAVRREGRLREVTR